MILSNEKIKELIEGGPSDKIILARKKAAHRNMHVTGKGLIEFLERLDSYETIAQKNLREKLAKSNRSNFSFILRPTDKIFTAKGGATNYNLPQNQISFLKDNINQVADGLDIKKYLKKKVRKEYVIDPNGVLFVDIDKEGELETHVIPTNEIMWYEAKGNRVEAIIFEFVEKSDDKRLFLENVCNVKFADYRNTFPNSYHLEKKYYRVIDEVSDRIFVREKRIENSTIIVDGIYEEEGSSISNYFKYVPALILGDEKDKNTGLFDSIIEDLLDDADTILRRTSVMTVHELAHLYPRYWAYAQACTRCSGEGEIHVPTANTEPQEYTSSTCSSCGGTGHKTRTNPSDETVVPVPQDGDPILNKMMGFESPDLETAKFYESVIKSQREEMFRAMWGTTYEVGGKRETATGRFLDAQPVNDRLGDMSYTFAKMHKFLLDCYGTVILQKQNYESSVTYGRRYVFEGPDDILQKYQEVSRDPVSDLTKMDLQLRYIEAEYQDDPIELVKRKKLMRVEPFPALSCEKVMTMEFITESEKLKKLYFGEWLNSLRDEQIIFLEEKELKQLLNTYILTKQLTDGTEEVQS
jgi:hypothetical protein